MTKTAQINNVFTWQPSNSVTTIIAWYRSDTVTVDGSNNVTSWTDKGPNSYHATPPGNKPTKVAGVINGLPVIRFAAASSQYLKFANPGTAATLLDASTPFTVVLVCRSTLASQPNFPTALFMKTGTSKSQSFLFDTNAEYPNFQLGGGDGTGQVGVGVNTFNSYSQFTTLICKFSGGGNWHTPGYWTVSNAGVSLPVNVGLNVANSTAGENTIGAYGSGGGIFFDGDIAEIIIYADSISAADTAMLDRYLQLRYNPVGSYSWIPNVKNSLGWWFRSDTVTTSGTTCLTWPELGNVLNINAPDDSNRRSIDFSYNPLSGTLVKPVLHTSVLNGKNGLYFDINSTAFLGGSDIVIGVGRANFKSWDPALPFSFGWVANYDAIASGSTIITQRLSQNPDTEDGLLVAVGNAPVGTPEFFIGTSFGNYVGINNFYADGKLTQPHYILVQYNPALGTGVADAACWRVIWNGVVQTVSAFASSVGLTNLNMFAAGVGDPNTGPGYQFERFQWNDIFNDVEERQFIAYMKSYWNL